MRQVQAPTHKGIAFIQVLITENILKTQRVRKRGLIRLRTKNFNQAS